MGFRYALLGAGRQGLAAAYDLARQGEAEEILLLDADPSRLDRAVGRLNRLAGREVVRGAAADVSDAALLAQALAGRHAALSALPTRLNEAAASAAVEARCHFNDLGGDIGIARRILSLDDRARQAGISLVPECGLAPGLANLIAVAGMERFDTPRTVKIWCGGLPREPLPPLGYKLLYDIGALTGEYSDETFIIRAGKVTRVAPLEELEEIEFPPPVGSCEAFLTAGGASTCPWTFEGKLDAFEYRSVRYPGHRDQIRTLSILGFLENVPVAVGSAEVIPRELTGALLTRRLSYPEEPDLVVLRVRVAGKKKGRQAAAVFDLLDHSDPATGFTAMERCTGFAAATVTWMQARGEIASGARPQELAVPVKRFLEELPRRGLALKESLEPGGR